MKIILLLFYFMTIAIAESDQLLQSVRSLSDYSKKLNIGMNSFPGAVIYVVNPLKSTGFLWWKKYAIKIIKEPDWTLFKLGAKNFDKKDEIALRDLLLQ